MFLIENNTKFQLIQSMFIIIYYFHINLSSLNQIFQNLFDFVENKLKI